MHDKNSRLPGEGPFAVLMAVVSIIAVWKAYGISGFESLSAPGTFPMAVAMVMLIAALAFTARTLRLPKSVKVTSLTTILPMRVLFMIVMVVFYALAVKPLGFLPTSFLFLLVSMQVLRGGNLLRNAGISLLCLIIVYAVFRLIFAVLMPEGIVPEREILSWFRALFTGGAH